MCETAALLTLTRLPYPVWYSTRSEAPLERWASRPGWLERVMKELSTDQAS